MRIAWLGRLIDDYGRAFEVGLLPFLPGDAMRVALGAILLPRAWKAIARMRG